MDARRFIVRGRVQGVGFRFFTVTCAEALGLSGWVRNLADGSVEVHAEGAQAQLDELRFDLSRGPRYARVVEVVHEDVPPEGLAGFTQRR